jgi:hypothetical protein
MISKLNDGLKSVAVPASHLIPSEAEGRPKAELKYPSLDDLRWRVEVTISTSALSRVLKPSVLLEMTLSDGTISILLYSYSNYISFLDLIIILRSDYLFLLLLLIVCSTYGLTLFSS